MTRCEELQFDLPLYFDGSLNPDERGAVDAHLPECPLCRQKLSEFEELFLGLRALPRYSVPEQLVDNIRASVASQLTPSRGAPSFGLIDRRRRWSEVWLAPSAAAAFATLVIGFALLSFMVAPSPVQLSASTSASRQTSTPVFLPGTVTDLSPGEYASTRLAIAGESPSINPQGALVAMTKSLVRGNVNDDEVTVVADVFGNGLAQIAEVVEPSKDRRAVEELQKALESDPAYAPFVPANMDQRSGTIRVILKIQNVNVSTRVQSQ
jgi:hypothetical protein